MKIKDSLNATVNLFIKFPLLLIALTIYLIAGFLTIITQILIGKIVTSFKNSKYETNPIIHMGKFFNNSVND